MADKFHHEQLYRGAERMAKYADVLVTVCGAGAIGSNLVDNLVRQGFEQLRVIDHDRVEEHNVSTQVYGQDDVGAWKTDVLAHRVFQSVGVEIDCVRKELNARSVRKLLSDSEIVIDTFDNSDSRQAVQQHCRTTEKRCLHVGLFEGLWRGDLGRTISCSARYRSGCL